MSHLENMIALGARGASLLCQREHREHWVVIAYHGNASAFNGYHWTPSDYSACRCEECGRVWRTKAAYVDDLSYPSRRRFEGGGAIDPTTTRPTGKH